MYYQIERIVDRKDSTTLTTQTKGRRFVKITTTKDLAKARRIIRNTNLIIRCIDEK
jgi:hypothetical protein